MIQIVASLTGTITRKYEDLNRLTAETTPQGSVSYTYSRTIVQFCPSKARVVSPTKNLELTVFRGCTLKV